MKPGEKIKALRKEKNLELNEVADRVQLEVKQLEGIETGDLAPSLGVLIKLSRALGVRLGTFLDDQLKQGAVITRKGDASETPRLAGANNSATEKLAFFSLAKEKADRHMEPFIIDIKPGVPSNPLASTHEGEEFIYVLSGSVSITYGKEEFILNEGDSIYLDSIVNHQVYSANDQSAKLLAVVYLPV
ncbi:helix-turn-helix domain-containing protein [Alkalitalea saponilacus]|uniref:Transcriptional regulator, XRE family with cupin sensor n=1 Tax=Alkalitalea saponilacus TaxID=889453 RepID=A0A1T5H7V0_9BACT|nr:XRE family transcriptional regulator [Alkalitalea saponilacus]ASB50858.1 DNA-binding protein [Alkalitalea saponilacus]SKC16640.1 transcriptional regulator, XRE family with cupin sensor [Alkalitalea saponilacus]